MAWNIAAAWNTGDINARVTSTCAVINDAGVPKIIAPVQHGVKAFDSDGNLLWTYTSITNGYDVRHIAVGDLTGSGYNDCAVVCSGYYTTSTDGKVAILDPDGSALQLLLTSNFTGSPSGTNYAVTSGTDIYISSTYGLHKFVKSGSTWSESWVKNIGAAKMIAIDDIGNGTRIIVDTTSIGVKCYQTDGTLDWTQGGTNQYQGVFAIGKLDSTKTGDQIVLPYQSGGMIIDKDGNNVGSFTPSNVGGGVCVYDCDGDGEDEFYFSDMARDVYCYERTGTNTYSVKYTLSDVITNAQYAGLAHFDINGDGDDEIFIFTTDGYCYIYDKTLATLIKSLNIGHGVAGGYSLSSYQNLQNGIIFADISGNGQEDLVISGGTGYVDVFQCYEGPLYRTSTKVNWSSGDGTIDVPTGTTNGDLLLLFVGGDMGASEDHTYTVSGFTQALADTRSHASNAGVDLQVFYRVASSEPANYTIDIDSDNLSGAVMVRLDGQDASDQFDASTIVGYSNSTEAKIPSLASTVANTLLIGGVSWDESKTQNSLPAGWTEAQHVDVSGLDISVIYRIRPAAVTTAVAQYDLSASSPHVGAVLAIQITQGGASATKTFTVDAALWKQATKTLAVDAHLYRVSTKTFAVDALLYALRTKTIAVDAHLWRQGTKTVSIDALLVEYPTVVTEEPTSIVATGAQLNGTVNIPGGW